MAKDKKSDDAPRVIDEGMGPTEDDLIAAELEADVESEGGED